MQEPELLRPRTRLTYEFCKVAFFLSRYGVSDIDGHVHPPEILGATTWRGAYALFYNALGQQRDPDSFYHSLKNARDRFDAHIPGSGRIGWRQTDANRSPGRLPPLYHEVLEDTAIQTEGEIYEWILGLIADPALGSIYVQPYDTEVIYTGIRTPNNETNGSNRTAGRRRSPRATITGLTAELWVMGLLEKNLGTCASSLRHHSVNGETPGYDISYTDRDGTKKAIEVKGTDLARMTSFELTDNELNAAKTFGSNYTVWLVLNVGKDMRYRTLNDPCGRAESNKLEITTSDWLVQGFNTSS